MGSLFKVEKSGTTTLPSGIEAELTGLTGKHQALITINDETKRRKGIDEMLLSCLKRLGDKTSFVTDDVQKLLSADRKKLLFELRNISNNNDKSFIFDYEFPTQGGKKLKQRYTVDFLKDDFPCTPYGWVKEEMIRNYKEVNGITKALTDDEENEAIAEPFPVMFEDYADIIALSEVVTELPECGMDIKWNMLNGKEEVKYAKLLQVANITSHTQIEMRRPQFQNTELEGNPYQRVPLDDLSLNDIEALRKDIMAKEGNVDSYVVVQYKNDASIQSQVDLVSTPAFFFSSLAI